jgi:hypothetical protein
MQQRPPTAGAGLLSLVGGRSPGQKVPPLIGDSMFESSIPYYK